MVHACIIPTCKAQWAPNSNLSFFRIKTDEAIFEKWQKVIPNLQDVKKHHAICSKHFAPECIREVSGRKYLTKDAVPTIFENEKVQSNNVQQSTKRKFDLHDESGLQSGNKGSPSKQMCSVHVQTSLHGSSLLRREANLRAKIKTLQKRLKRRDQRIQSTVQLVQHLREKGKCTDNLENDLLTRFKDFTIDLFLNEHKNSQVSKYHKTYTEPMKDFATTLYFYSPRAYNFVSQKINLPHERTLRKWVQKYVCEVGFLSKVFEYLKEVNKNSTYLRYVALIFDEMAIRSQVIWDRQSDKYWGGIDYGKIQEKLEIKIDSTTLATHCLVFQIVSYSTKFKCPSAHFFINSLSADIQSKLLLEAIRELYKIGITVLSVTCDGSNTNQRTLQILGCNFCMTNDMKAHFKHTECDKNIHVIIDPCHIIKLARNTFAECEISSGEGYVHFDYVVSLHEVQQEEGFRLANRLTSRHINFYNSKMKVSLASQTISSGVADAIQFLREAKHKKFEKSEATEKFIRVFDRLFDIQNSRSVFGKHFESPLRLENSAVWEDIFNEAKEYIQNLKINNLPVLQVKRKMFALGSLINIESFRNIAYQLLCKIENPLQYFLTYKCSQDHLELYFCCLRSRGGWNNNPNVLQLMWSVRKLLYRNSVTPSINANCFVEDFEPTPIVEFRTEARKMIEFESTDTLFEDHQLNILLSELENESLSFIQENILYYITGSIVKRFVSHSFCAHCNEIVYTEGGITDHNYAIDVTKPTAFTSFVNRGKLLFPSPIAYEIIKFLNVLSEGK